MEHPAYDALLIVLKNLDKERFQRFCSTLCKLQVPEGYRRFPRSQLLNTDPNGVVQLIRDNYTDVNGAKMAAEILATIDEKDGAAQVMGFLSEEKNHFVDRHREDLIRCIHFVRPILDGLRARGLLRKEDILIIEGKRSPEEQMMELYCRVTRWENTEKDIFYKILKENEGALIRSLEEEDRMSLKAENHFVDRHREDLIHSIHSVRPIVDALKAHRLLAAEDYLMIYSKRTSRERMRELYSKIARWDDTEKDTLYDILKEQEGALIRSLEEKDKMSPKPENHFVDRHREVLIRSIHFVWPVLHGLRVHRLLTNDDYFLINAKSTSEEKMTELYRRVTRWDSTAKDVFYDILKEEEGSLIRSLEEEGMMPSPKPEKSHFVDRHREALIRSIHFIRPILEGVMRQGLLTEEDYLIIDSKSTSAEQMMELYSKVTKWNNTAKDIFYNILKEEEGSLIRSLEGEGMMPSPKPEKNHFVDRHREDLIRSVHFVVPILYGLRAQGLLTEDDFRIIRSKSTSEEKMAELYSRITSWNNTEKDILYDILRVKEGALIRSLEEKDMILSPKAGTNTKIHMEFNRKPPPVQSPLKSDFQKERSEKSDFETPEEDRSEQSELSSDLQTAEQPTSSAPVQHHWMECKLCGKAPGDATVLVPEKNEFKLNSYRLIMQSSGLFRCSYTGIQFLVSAAVTIEFTVELWTLYYPQIQTNGYTIAGPLFNIKTKGEADKILELYLPHHLCLNGITEEDLQIKCAHFIDGNIALETPAKIEPFYAVLQKPTFSLWSVIQKIKRKKQAVHINVLTYFKGLCMEDPERTEYKIHLYFVLVPSGAEQSLNIKKGDIHFQRIEKPPQALQRVYTDTKYDVHGAPNATTIPQFLEIRSKFIEAYHLSAESLPYTEISFKQKEISIVVQQEEGTVWQAMLSDADIGNLITEQLQREQRNLSQEIPGPSSPSEHFVDIHRLALIDRLSHVDPVLDYLLEQRLLNQEQYEIIRNKEPHQEKMRQLYLFMTIWSNRDKEKLYRAIWRTNEPLIRDLEGH